MAQGSEELESPEAAKPPETGSAGTLRRPLLFNTRRNQEFLLHLHRTGIVKLPRHETFGLLERAGLVVRFDTEHGSCAALDQRHPAFDALRLVLTEISGEPAAPFTLPKGLPKPKSLVRHALGHQDAFSFRIVLQIVLADEPINLVTLQQRLQDEWAAGIERATKRLIEAEVLTYTHDARLTLGPAVPPTLRRFILETAHAFSDKDPYLAQRSTVVGPRPHAFLPGRDGAARLFGTDARLRNLMALAVHGPLLLRELRRITGANHMALENKKVAQFGRGDVVRVWQTDDGPAIMLDEAFPLARPLQRLLVALERAYPLPLYVPECDAPVPPEPQPWHGDRLALFGGIIPTTILASIGVHGWTFEALCVAVCIGHDRFNIKKAMRRLEDEGVLQGDRRRCPGMNVRVVTVAEGFPAKAELETLLRAYARAWPGIADDVKSGFGKIGYERPRTKVHLAKRGLWPY